MPDKQLSDLREEYEKDELTEDSVKHDPLDQFQLWLEDAISAGIREPNAMCLSTVGMEGHPVSRIVLLKGIEDSGFIFYTNYKSTKGIEIEENPMVALNFFWPELERQVRVEGVAEMLDPKTSDKYFNSRPRGSQIGAHVSPQSQIIKSREYLDDRLQEVTDKYEGKEVPRPGNWGGYIVFPNFIEFWQGRKNRLHDRICFKLDKDSWEVFRLAP